MPKPIDAHPASPGAREETFQVYARNRVGTMIKVGAPKPAASANNWLNGLTTKFQPFGLTFWIEKMGDIDLSSEPEIGALARDDALAVAQLPEPPEPARRGVVDPGLRVCAGVRRPVIVEQIEKQIIDDFKKWTVFGLFMILGGFLVLLIHLVFLAM